MKSISVVLLLCFSGAWAADAPAPVTAQSTAKPPTAKPPTATSKPAEPTKTANDQLTLDSTLVTGNRELPKVMYIVPWKKAELNNLPGQPFNTLVDEVLAPVDREVFRREVEYYQVIADKDRAATPVNDRK